MPIIQFDVLVPDAQAERVAEVFSTATQKLLDNGTLSAANVTRVADPKIPEGLDAQLRQTYRDEHEDRELEDANVYRYDINVEGVKGSVNQLTMVLARLLTPHAVLPKDHVLLEDEVAHERPAIFPWSVQVQP
ncbi:hypothetical protein ACL1HS_05585 [Corynebacterium striatum]|uniref:hypothetical protein n=1 Tax=Corynebacterium TaxID=1716 RepID=UPI0011CC7E14|nr:MULTISPECIES: hypothetical protein [Corynebacterium]MCG7249253.1 hypothetical protein [Corynebacterium striatum]NHY10826.1 hypothetical protein [Corynebacterium striatum]NHY35321.1 hypothetical protein [Corynebacterium striatum]QQU79404.1 hypothetical protein I6I73_11915 [Corynebacterium striatum]TXS64729.1 hypothetical protein CHU71_04950 [Corynebacterium sp. LK14]